MSLKSFMTFPDMLSKMAWRMPEKTFLYLADRDQSWTYAEGERFARRAAGALSALGVGHGDRVAIFAHNGLDYVAAMFGAWKLGAVSTHINVLNALQLRDFVATAEPRVLVYSGDMHLAVERDRASMPSVMHFICFDGPRQGAPGWSDLLDAAAEPPDSDVSDTDAAHFSFTSGTSGKPKGVVLSHGHTARATQCIAERLGIESSDVSLGPTSLSSSYHLVANLLPCIHRGAAVGLMATWDPELAWDEMDRRGVTILPSNPLLLADLLSVSRRRTRPPKRLRIALSGGGPVPPDLKRAYRAELGITLVESYGQSELGGFVALGYPRPASEQQIAAVGPCLPDKEVRIVDGGENEVPIGSPGEIVLRGGFMSCYWQMPVETAHVLRGGWLHTGDMGRMDADGYIHMLGRWSERVTSAGRVIFPRPMEECLLRHPGVRYAAVIGKPDRRMGEIPKAVVQLREGATASPETLMEHCRQMLGEESSPALVEVIQQIPMTPTGKISRSELQSREKSA